MVKILKNNALEKQTKSKRRSIIYIILFVVMIVQLNFKHALAIDPLLSPEFQSHVAPITAQSYTDEKRLMIAQSEQSENILRAFDFFLGLMQRKSNMKRVHSGKCSSRLNTEGLLQRSWINEAKQFLRGRQNIYYYFNKSTKRVIFRHEGQNYALWPRPISEADARHAQRLLYRLDQLISLDFKRTYYANNADLLVYLICERNAHYGEVIDHPSGTKQIMFLNECTGEPGKVNRMDYKFLHEMGHVLGLEHPFDGDDGDCLFTTAKFSSKSAHLGQTLMAYREPPFGNIPSFYTPLDVRALVEAWGPE